MHAILLFPRCALEHFFESDHVRFSPNVERIHNSLSLLTRLIVPSTPYLPSDLL